MAKATVGRALGLVGGVLAAAGALLPWATASGGSVPDPGAPLLLTQAAGGWGAWTILAFGAAGAVLALTPRRVAPLLDLEVGAVVLFLSVMAWLSVPAIAASLGGPDAAAAPSFGLALALAGGALLVLGGALAARGARAAAPPEPSPGAPPPEGPAPPPPPET